MKENNPRVKYNMFILFTLLMNLILLAEATEVLHGEPEPVSPTEGNPLTLSRKEFYVFPNNLYVVKLGIYNYLDKEIDVDISINCQDNIAVIENYQNDTILSENSKTIIVIFKSKQNIKKGTYECTLHLNYLDVEAKFKVIVESQKRNQFYYGISIFLFILILLLIFVLVKKNKTK